MHCGTTTSSCRGASPLIARGEAIRHERVRGGGDGLTALAGGLVRVS